jgi:hypothetical protein
MPAIVSAVPHQAAQRLSIEMGSIRRCRRLVAIASVAAIPEDLEVGGGVLLVPERRRRHVPGGVVDRPDEREPRSPTLEPVVSAPVVLEEQALGGQPLPPAPVAMDEPGRPGPLGGRPQSQRWRSDRPRRSAPSILVSSLVRPLARTHARCCSFAVMVIVVSIVGRRLTLDQGINAAAPRVLRRCLATVDNYALYARPSTLATTALSSSGLKVPCSATELPARRFVLNYTR